MRQRCRRDYGFCLPRQILDSLGGCELGLREDDDATIYAEQVEDRQMLKRLRHNPVIDGDCQKGKIDPACTCEHRVNEALVAWNIDEADRLPRSRGHIGEAQVNRDAAGFLILQPVASDARQRFDQSRLAVIDVTGEANNHGSASVDDRSSEGAPHARLRVVTWKCDRLERNASSSPKQRRSSTRRSFSIRPMTGRGSSRSIADRRSSSGPLRLEAMARPALAMVSSGSAPEPIWLWHSQSSTAKSSPSAAATCGSSRRACASISVVIASASAKSEGAQRVGSGPDKV